MAEGGFEPYHVPQQSRRDKLRVVASHNQLQLQGCASGLAPILDPSLISSDLITCAGPSLHHHHNNSLGDQSSNPVGGKEGPNFMGYVGGGMITASSSSSATNNLYVGPQSSVQLNPSQIQEISGNPFLYTPQSLRFLEQSLHGGGEVMVYRREPVSPLGHGPNIDNHTNSSNNNSSTCGQGLSLSLSSHHSQQTSLPLELNLQKYDSSSMYSTAKVVSTGGCFVPGAGEGSTSNELLSRNSVPLGPFTGYASILKGSRFLKPAQQLLEELCDVGRGVYTEKMVANDSILLDPPPECFSGNDDDLPSCRNGGESENRKKKSSLISMLNEVYRRYKQYYQQMQAVISSFESVAGVRNAAPFASLTLKAMSKHFRYLKNAIAEQLQLMIDSRGHLTSSEKDTASGFDNPGTGIHCQRPPQNTGFLEHQPVWRPQRGLPERAVTVLRSWLFEHFLHPYPTDTDKLMLAKQTGLSRNQVSNWFINARVRLWKPMVEEIHMLETRQAQKGSQREEQNDPMASSVQPISCENSSTSTNRIGHELGSSKRTRNDLTVIPIPIPAGNENVVNISSYENSSNHHHHHLLPLGFGVSKAVGNGGVSLTLGLHHQNISLGLPDPFPINAARRFGLDTNGEGFAVGSVSNPNRPFGREIVGGQLLHDFVG